MGFTGPLCASPSPSVCLDAFCNRPSITVRRLDEGDQVFLSSANSSYCSSIQGFCAGGSGGCGSCQCDFGTTYAQNTSMCESFSGGEYRQVDREAEILITFLYRLSVSILPKWTFKNIRLNAVPQVKRRRKILLFFCC